MTFELLRPSKLGDWATCARKVRYVAANASGGGGPHISTWIGTAVHRKLSQEVPDAVPAGVLYDKTTPNIETARTQVSNIHAKIRELCVVYGLIFSRTEVPVTDGEHEGTLDVVFARDCIDQISVIGDIKTGKRIPNGVWLQLGSYYGMATHPEYYALTEEVREVCVVHVPRTPLHLPQPGVIEFRDGAACARDAELWFRMLDYLKDTELDLSGEASEPQLFPASPGIACHSCPMTAEECAVKIVTPGAMV